MATEPESNEFINFHNKRLDIYNHVFEEQRAQLHNLLGLIILGGFILLFQENLLKDHSNVKSIITVLYFISLISMLLSRYLFTISYRKWAYEVYVHTVNPIHKETNAYFKYPKHTDLAANIYMVLSLISFLLGSDLGLYYILNFSLFMIVLAMSLLCIIVPIYVEFRDAN